MSCPPGMILNPRTLRCIRSNSRIAQNLVKEGVIANYYVAPPRKTYRRQKGPTPCRPDQQRNPITGRCKKISKTYKRKLYSPPPPFHQQIPFGHRRILSEGPARAPRGTATVAPMGASLNWIYGNCRNQQDPLTGTPFSYMNPYDLQDVVRLHDRTCVAAQPLHYKVAGEHGAGRMAMMPGHTGQPMSQSDFDALRDAMRRRNPAYRIPSRIQGSRFY